MTFRLRVPQDESHYAARVATKCGNCGYDKISDNITDNIKGNFTI